MTLSQSHQLSGTMNSHSAKGYPHLNWLPRIYACLLRATRRHGLFTLARNHVRWFPRGQFIRLPVGGEMYLPPDPHFFGYLTGLHEAHITWLLRQHIRPGARCIDVGANIGYFTLMLARLAGAHGDVIAYEPVPENFAVLRFNADLASQQNARITAVNAAVSDNSEPMRIVRKAESTLHQVEKTSALTRESVQAVTLDEETYRWGESTVIDFLKIDVEGHEQAVIDGARQILALGKIRHLVIEVTPGKDAGNLDQLLRSLGGVPVAWLDHTWQPARLENLSVRTDVWVCIDRRPGLM